MMNNSQTEEQFPLLLFLVGDQETEKTNKRFSGKGRFDRITTGAAAVITEWPKQNSTNPNNSSELSYRPWKWNLLRRNFFQRKGDEESCAEEPDKYRFKTKRFYNVGSCCMTAVLCCLTLFLFSLMIFSCMMSIEMQHHRLPRCTKNYVLDNKTIHLVHNSHKWSQKQMELVENITHSFPNFRIHLIIIKNKYLLLNKIAKLRKRRVAINKTDVVGDNQNEIKKLQHNETTIEELLLQHSNIDVSYYNYNNVFEKTPLYLNWVMFTDDLKIFAIRILQLWQYGGISFDLNGYRKFYSYRTTPGELNSEIITGRGMDNFIHNGSENDFDNLRARTVTIDNKGLHMATKTPCHSFFGNILMTMKRVPASMTPEMVLRRPLFSYCRTSVVDAMYCISSPEN